MFVPIGYIIILACALGGYALAGGHLGALWQPLELLIIFGAAIGAFVSANDANTIKQFLKGLPIAFKGTPYNQAFYMNTLLMLYEVLSKIRKEGLMSIEKDIENPSESALFKKYPLIAQDHHIMDFITDYLRMMVGGNLNAFEIDALIDAELDTHHAEAHRPAAGVRSIADGLPAFGIVAAVMGVVHTMGSVGQPPAVLGEMIAHALVGTFLGILLAYGFVTPVANIMEIRNEEEAKAYQVIKMILMASINGYAPALAVEFGRKVLTSNNRPSFSELEQKIKDLKGK